MCLPSETRRFALGDLYYDYRRDISKNLGLVLSTTEELAGFKRALEMESNQVRAS